MTEQQDVLDPRRPRRRRTPAILLGMLPAAIAATVLLAGPAVEPAGAVTEASGTAKVAADRAQVTPGVIAPASKTAVDYVALVPQITVTVPTPKVTVAKTTTKKTTKSTKTTKTTKKSTKKSSSKKSSKKSSSSAANYKAFCADPGNAVSTSGADGKALLKAVNAERAKLGIAAMSWSSSMASTATNWSKSMVAADEKTSAKIDGLAHNPNRPGAENVAVVYSSGGYSGASAVKKMHSNLLHSNGHCLNLMNPKYTSMGAGVASSADGTTWYATENFR